MTDSENLRAEKAELRREVRAFLRGLDANERRKRSLRIVGRIAGWIEERGWSRVLTFAALPTEPDLEGLWELSLEWVFPKVVEDHLELWKISEPESLAAGYRGILEPREEEGVRVEISSLEGILVPGLAYSERDGSRLGQGGGFYDRLLAEHEVPTLGVCFEEQVRSDVPRETHDQQVAALATCERLLQW